MRVLIASEPGNPERDNEDFAAAAPGLALLIDGAHAPAGLRSGCSHSVAWYARSLGGMLLAAASDPGVSLPEALAVGIERVNGLHSATCDLDHPGVPSATVAMVRVSGGRFEHLVLSDSVVVLDLMDGGPAVISDDRLDRVQRKIGRPDGKTRLGTPEHAASMLSHVEELAAYRNRPGGFWVAGTKPEAAEHALTGSTPLTRLRAVALLSDGASRLADRFGLLTWPELLAVLDKDGPAELIAQTREAEAADPDGARWPRGKASDDATAVYWTLHD